VSLYRSLKVRFDEDYNIFFYFIKEQNKGIIIVFTFKMAQIYLLRAIRSSVFTPFYDTDVAERFALLLSRAELFC